MTSFYSTGRLSVVNHRATAARRLDSVTFSIRLAPAPPPSILRYYALFLSCLPLLNSCNFKAWFLRAYFVPSISRSFFGLVSSCPVVSDPIIGPSGAMIYTRAADLTMRSAPKTRLHSRGGYKTRTLLQK